MNDELQTRAVEKIAEALQAHPAARASVGAPTLPEDLAELVVDKLCIEQVWLTHGGGPHFVCRGLEES